MGRMAAWHIRTDSGWRFVHSLVLHLKMFLRILGAFIIYKADKNDDEILFANREFIRFAGCKNMDELLEYTKEVSVISLRWMNGKLL